MKEPTKGKLYPILLSALVILADQISKLIIVAHYPLSKITRVFDGDILWITHVRNKAIAFSLGHGLPDFVRQILFIVLPIAVLVLLM